ncbi:8236_t:CDS:2, partial [Racocetra fulgida]
MEENSEPSVANLSEVETEELDHVQTNKKNKRGRPKNPLWDHFVEINHQESGHKGWKCNYCHEENLRASDINMHAHLGLICQSAPLNIKQDCLRNFPAPKKKKIIHEIASGVQPRIDSKFQNISIMDPGQEQLCNKALIRFLGMKSLVFQDILRTALEIWKKLGGGLATANILVAQIKMYDAFEPPYNYTFMESVESPQTWWY